MRGKCKTPGGKLVGVDVDTDQEGNARSCRIDGDFFVMGDDGAALLLLRDLERALIQRKPLDVVVHDHPSVRLVGIDAGAIQTAYFRALRGDEDGIGRLKERSIVSQTADDDDREDFRRRWKSLCPKVVRDIARTPAQQMELDERWAREVAEGQRSATLRFWRWTSPAVVVGRFQSVDHEVDVEEARKKGFDVVRRCTGGGAMFVKPSDVVTYSLYAPQDFVKGLGIDKSFRLCDQWLIDALNGIGVPASFGGTNDIMCADGKMAGAAQRLFPARKGGPGALLHHTTLAYDIDVETMGAILRTSPEKMSDKAVKSARSRVSPLRKHTEREYGQVFSYFETYSEHSCI